MKMGHANSTFQSAWRIGILGLFLVSLALPAFGRGRKRKRKAPPVKKAPVGFVWDTKPTLEQIYDGYNPAFTKYWPGRVKPDLEFSTQKAFYNMANIKLDAQVVPIIEKANELIKEKKEYRRATSIYRRIMSDYPDELFPISKNGIFVPALLYVQRRILLYPQKELSYYRILFDPEAKDIYDRAVRRFSIYGYKELVRNYLATSYGDDALFALGNTALDNARYDEARQYYERIVTYHGLEDKDDDKLSLDRDQVWVRLAVSYKHLGRERDFQAAVKRIKNKNASRAKRLLAQLEKFKFDPIALHQRVNRRSRSHSAMDDKRLSEPMPYPLASNSGEWRMRLTAKSQCWEATALPWATETDLIYKDMNVLYSRSLLTGELNWVFGPGGSSLAWDKGNWRTNLLWYPNQSILVHDGVVFSNMFVYGPSLVAIDQFTGRRLWAKGPMAATSEDEWLDRFQASPAAGRGKIIVPIVHDDIRGRSHISTSAELAAYETRTGKLMWRTTLARIAPLKITQSRYPRKIRVLSSTPLVNEGVVYHVTNAGVVAAVDAQTGEVRWLTRYPQRKEVLDNFAKIGQHWRNEPPVIRGDKLFVTPVDSPFLLCLNKQNGRVLWTGGQGQDARRISSGGRGEGAFSGPVFRMLGFSALGHLILAGKELAFLNPDTGALVWKMDLQNVLPYKVPNIQKDKLSAKTRKRAPKGLEPGINGEGLDFWARLGWITGQPTVTRDGKIYFSMKGDYEFYSDYCLDEKKREIIHQRRWYTPALFINDQGVPEGAPMIKRVINEFDEGFDPSNRMSFTRWGVPFEVDITYNSMVVRYDSVRLKKILLERKDFDTVFAKAEIARKRGEIKVAIGLYEKCKQLLPSEEEDRRRNLNLRLNPLYTEMARWGHQAGDLSTLEFACRNMGATASNPMQEIRALLAYSEFHERNGNIPAAVAVLQNASRHYWREALDASLLEVQDRGPLMETAKMGLANLLGEMPEAFAVGAKGIFENEASAVGDYFLSVANTDRKYVVEARMLLAKKIRALLRRAPESFRKTYAANAAKELSRYDDLKIGERLLWCWPEAGGGKEKLLSLLGKTEKLNPGRKAAQLWRFDDLARACGFGDSTVTSGKAGLKRAGLPTLPASGGWNQVEAKNEDADMVRLVLPQKGEVAGTSSLLFAGGRKRRSYGNRFSVMCWDMKANKQVWESRDILLYGGSSGDSGGYEVGFEEVFIHGDLAIVHGRYDVIAMNWKAGAEKRPNGKKDKRWHFRVPVGFEIRSMDLFGDVLVLCGRGSTVTLSPKTGAIIWDALEAGEYYAGPYFHKDVMLTVRQSPAEVAFRRVGSGRLLSRLSLSGVSANRKHPIFVNAGGSQNQAAVQAAAANPVAFGEGCLAVTDGLNYQLIDVERQRIRWTRKATKLDLSSDPSYRMWIDGGLLFVLKPYYSVLENVVFNLDSGTLAWRRREGGKKQDKDLRKFEQGAEGGKAATGLVLGSMAFLNGKVYGIKQEMSKSTVKLVGMDPDSGNQIMEVSVSGFNEPEAYVEPSWSKGCVTVRIQDGNKFELWQVDVIAKKVVQRIKLKGYGRLGEYGGASMIWQGPYHAVWTFQNRKMLKP